MQTGVTSDVWQERLTLWRVSRDVEPIVFEYCNPRERLIGIERVCRRWRDRSRAGVGWTSTFDVTSATWRAFLRFGAVGGEEESAPASSETKERSVLSETKERSVLSETKERSVLREFPKTFGEYLTLMGTRFCAVKSVSNFGLPGGYVRAEDCLAIELALASPVLRSVSLVTTSPEVFVSRLSLIVPKLTDTLVFVKVRARGAGRVVGEGLDVIKDLREDLYDELFSKITAKTLSLQGIIASPRAFLNLASGKSGESLRQFQLCMDKKDRAWHSLEYLDGFRNLGELSLVDVRCGALPRRVGTRGSLTKLALHSVLFAESCSEAVTPFTSLTRLSLSSVVMCNFAQSTIAANVKTLVRLCLTGVRLCLTGVTLPVQPFRAASDFPHLLVSASFDSLSELIVANPRAVPFYPRTLPFWTFCLPVLSKRLVHLTTLILDEMGIDDRMLGELADFAKPQPRLQLRTLSLSRNPQITADGFCAFLNHIELPHLTDLIFKQTTPLQFSSSQRLFLTQKLPNLAIF